MSHNFQFTVSRHDDMMIRSESDSKHHSIFSATQPTSFVRPSLHPRNFSTHAPDAPADNKCRAARAAPAMMLAEHASGWLLALGVALLARPLLAAAARLLRTWAAVSHLPAAPARDCFWGNTEDLLSASQPLTIAKWTNELGSVFRCAPAAAGAAWPPACGE